tara:strand:+ start:156 stop:1142 length:987 start_codon:yes stop_codon:yes gene_type:complete
MISIIKRFITLGFILGLIFLVGFGYLSQKKSYSTPENEYERVYNQKITTLFDILIGPNEYYVNSTVFLRHKEERSLQYVRTPKSILYEKETVQNSSESNRTQTPEIKIKKNNETLPGMNDVISTTRQYEVSQQITQKERSLQEKNESHREIIEEIYYDENKIEVIKPKHGLERIHILFIVNLETLSERDLTIEMIKSRIQQIIPLKEERGDQLIIEAKLIDFTPPYIKLAKAIFTDTFMKKNIRIGLILLVIGIVLYGAVQLILLLRRLKEARKPPSSIPHPEALLSEKNIDEAVIPLNKKVIKTIEGDTQQTHEIVEYWMEQHYAQK